MARGAAQANGRTGLRTTPSVLPSPQAWHATQQAPAPHMRKLLKAVHFTAGRSRGRTVRASCSTSRPPPVDITRTHQEARFTFPGSLLHRAHAAGKSMPLSAICSAFSRFSEVVRGISSGCTCGREHGRQRRGTISEMCMWGAE